ncbi:unnamed protein product, partial [Meganyctiphanes norvegica]
MEIRKENLEIKNVKEIENNQKLCITEESKLNYNNNDIKELEIKEEKPEIQNVKENMQEYKCNLPEEKLHTFILSPSEDEQRISEIKRIHYISEMELSDAASSSREYHLCTSKLDKDISIYKVNLKDETNKDLSPKKNDSNLMGIDENAYENYDDRKEALYSMLDHKDVGNGNEYENYSYGINREKDLTFKKVTETADSIIKDLLSYVNKSKLITEISNENEFEMVSLISSKNKVLQESNTKDKNESIVQKETDGASLLKRKAIDEFNVEMKKNKSLINLKEFNETDIKFDKKKKGRISEMMKEHKNEWSQLKTDAFFVKSKISNTRKCNIPKSEKIMHEKHGKNLDIDKSKEYGDCEENRKVYLPMENQNNNYRSVSFTENDSKGKNRINNLCEEESKEMLITSDKSSLMLKDDLLNKNYISIQELENDIIKEGKETESSDKLVENLIGYVQSRRNVLGTQISSFVEDIRCAKDYEKSDKARSPDRNAKQKMDKNEKGNAERQKKCSVFKRLGPDFQKWKESKMLPSIKNINEKETECVIKENPNHRINSEKDQDRNDSYLRTSPATS